MELWGSFTKLHESVHSLCPSASDDMTDIANPTHTQGEQLMHDYPTGVSLVCQAFRGGFYNLFRVQFFTHGVV